tara:strand:+ start:994 stop:1938 length:945 start_codon:yes stop_codon:yes gene_type:complete
MSKVLVVIKSMGIGDLCILIPNIHAISKKIAGPVTVLAQKNTRAEAILKHDPHIKEVIELDENEIKGFLNIIKKIKVKNFDQAYIYSDSIRLYLISKLSSIKKIFHYPFFSKQGKNFFRTAKEFTENILHVKVDSQSKIYFDEENSNTIKSKFNISDEKKNIVCGISASGPTKRWDVENYIKLLENLNSKYKCNFFLAAGKNDEDLVNQVVKSSIGKNCISFSKMSIAETIPIIGSCKYYIGNDTGWGHIASGLGLKALFLFMDSPPLAYGVYSKNISVIVPEGESINSCTHNTRGKNKISFEKVFSKTVELID